MNTIRCDMCEGRGRNAEESCAYCKGWGEWRACESCEDPIEADSDETMCGACAAYWEHEDQVANWNAA